MHQRGVRSGKFEFFSQLIYAQMPPVTLFNNTWMMDNTGLEIATDTVANATNIFSLATKNSSLVAKVATRFLYDLDLK